MLGGFVCQCEGGERQCPDGHCHAQVSDEFRDRESPANQDTGINKFRFNVATAKDKTGDNCGNAGQGCDQ